MEDSSPGSSVEVSGSIIREILNNLRMMSSPTETKTNKPLPVNDSDMSCGPDKKPKLHHNTRTFDTRASECNMHLLANAADQSNFLCEKFTPLSDANGEDKLEKKTTCSNEELVKQKKQVGVSCLCQNEHLNTLNNSTESENCEDRKPDCEEKCDKTATCKEKLKHVTNAQCNSDENPNADASEIETVGSVSDKQEDADKDDVETVESAGENLDDTEKDEDLSKNESEACPETEEEEVIRVEDVDKDGELDSDSDYNPVREVRKKRKKRRNRYRGRYVTRKKITNNDDSTRSSASVACSSENKHDKSKGTKSKSNNGGIGTQTEHDEVDESYEDDSGKSDNMDCDNNTGDAKLEETGERTRFYPDFDEDLFYQTASGSKRFKVEMDMDKLWKPLHQGWKREVVIRGIYEEYTKTGKPRRVPADVYYYTPDGIKLRSMVQIVSYLQDNDSDLSLENFNFLRKPIFKPPFEIVRHAGSRGFGRKSKTAVKGSRNDLPKPEVVIERDGDEEDNEEEFDKVDDVESSPECCATLLPSKRPLEEPNATTRRSKRKKKSVARKSTTQLPKAATYGKVNKEEFSQPCSLNCPGLSGLPPTLHCDICMCLFHPGCVDLNPLELPALFVCKSCQKNTGSSGGSSSSAHQENNKTNSNSNNNSQSAWNGESAAKIPVITAPMDKKPDSPKSFYSVTTSTGGSKHQVVMNNLRSILNGRSASETFLSQTLPSSPASFPRPVSSSRSTFIVHSASSLSSIHTLLHEPSPHVTMSNSLTGSLSSLSSTPVTSPIISKPNVIIQNSKSTANSTMTISPVTQTTINSLPSVVTSTSAITVPPPKLSAAPSHSSVTVTSTTNQQKSQSSTGTTNQSIHIPTTTLFGNENYPKSGQLLTLPSAVAKRLNPSQPLALRINNMQLVIPPSRCINTAEGLKVFLPPKTFPVQSGSTTTMNVTFAAGHMPTLHTKDISKVNESKIKSPQLKNTDLDKDSQNSKASMKEPKRRGINPAVCHFRLLYSGFTSMLQIFHYLNAGDLVRSSLVCRAWHKLATQENMWKTVHLQNTKISDWNKAAQFFSKKRVEKLSLKDLQCEDDWNKVWHHLTPVLEKLKTLRQLHFDQVPASMLHTVCEKLPQLEELIAENVTDFTSDQKWTTPTKVDIGKFSTLKELRKLQLHGPGGLTLPALSFSGTISELASLNCLQHLSLVSLKGLPDSEFGFLGELSNLKVLELGECSMWTSETYFQLGKLTGLVRLRLEYGGEIPDVGLSDALVNLKSLDHLELIMFTIADNLHSALLQLESLKTLVVWPDTSSQPALVNSNTLSVVSKLTSLKQLEWGVIPCQNSSIILNDGENVKLATDTESETNKNVEWIPFLSPEVEGGTSDTESMREFIGVRQLCEKLVQHLPQVHVKVFRTHQSKSEVINR